MKPNKTPPVGLASSVPKPKATGKEQGTKPNKNATVTITAFSPLFTMLRTPLEQGFSNPLSEDIHLLGDTLGEVIKLDAGPKIFNAVEKLRGLAREVRKSIESDTTSKITDIVGKFSLEEATQVLRAFTDYFYLVNEAEKGEIIRVNRERELASTPENPRKESIAHAISLLKQKGLIASQVQELINNLRIQPVFTAHPTEAKRPDLITSLDKLSNLTALRKTGSISQQEKDELEAEIKRTVASIWHTPKNRSEKPTPIEEAINSLPFMETAFNVIPTLHADLEYALQTYYPNHKFILPEIIRFGTWIGGDRDGNPNVTPEVTKEVVGIYAKAAISKYIEEVAKLKSELSINDHASSTLLDSIKKDSSCITLDARILKKHANEPYRIKLQYMQTKLENTLAQIDNNSRSKNGSYYQNAAELLEDLNLISSSLNESGLENLANIKSLRELTIKIKSFGFNLAELDIREHSDVHEKAVTEILESHNVSGKAYKDLSENEKVELLTKLLNDNSNVTTKKDKFSDETNKVLSVFNTIYECQNKIGNNCIRAYITSFTQDVSDLLEVLFLAKESGLVQVSSGKSKSVKGTIDIVPLFETVNDLQNASGLLEKLFENPFYKNYLASRGNFQEIMLGYSDSSKDGGYLAANIELHKAQRNIADVCNKKEISFRYFHGRGGSIGRGGGAAGKAIQAFPQGTVNGKIRLTEQGEVISARYSNEAIAHRQLESIVHAVLLSSINEDTKIAEDNWMALAKVIEEKARVKYRDLVYDDPEFWDFYTQATPINFISKLKIASRPSKRKGLEKIEDLRAIPWIFSWTQIRTMLPTWYGVGSALSYISEQKDGLDCLKEMYKSWPFFKTVIDNCQTAFAKADLHTANAYMSLVEPPQLANRVFGKTVDEYNLTREMILAVTGQEEILDNNKVIQNSIRLRNPYTDPLNYIQVELLRRLKTKEGNNDELVNTILLSVNGVAAAMQETG